jgi:aromatic-L-amino-acid decarboxylase
MMMDIDTFKKNAHELVDWMADYLQSVEKFPVKAHVEPGHIYSLIPQLPPDHPEDIRLIFDDFKKIILPGMTHWQSPNFFAYFPANSSYPSLLAEMLTATLGAQCMVWETSPAATELEEKMLDWLKKMIGLPEHFSGVLQDTASTATLTALLTAREKLNGFNINSQGFEHNKFRIYCSSETHSSIEKGVKIAGFGSSNLVKVDVSKDFSMNVDSLVAAIERDIKNRMVPLCIIATLGTTGSTAVDPLAKIAQVASGYNLWLHVDAAFVGTALLLPEYQWMIRGIDQVDSFVFNPHKWMFTNFDCSAYFVKDKESLIKTFSINPEYLKTQTTGVNDYRDWGIQLGRRFRALKLWFVIRNFGVHGLTEKIRHHISLAEIIEKKITNSEDFEIVTPRIFNLVCFRFRPHDLNQDALLNSINKQFLKLLNETGRVYLSHTTLNGIYTLRMVTGQTYINESHVNNAWEVIISVAAKMKDTLKLL